MRSPEARRGVRERKLCENISSRKDERAAAGLKNSDPPSRQYLTTRSFVNVRAPPPRRAGATARK